ncbi:MAG: host-nuclease inhibitor Gam family protein [Clostridium sp.]|nr:host-nuclease inhibitor Gam family protein [Clostridium sp.]
MELNKDDLLMDELEQFMLAAEIEELKVKLAGDTEEDGTLLVKNKSDADFYLRQINKLKQQKEEINEFVDQEIERQLRLYQEYREDRMRPLDNQIAFYENALKTFAMNEYAETNKKTIKLPNGTLAIKKQQPKYVYNDEQVLEFLQENNYKDYIRTKAEVNKKDLKKNATVNNNNELVIDGKVVPGVVVIPQEDKFEVK